MKKFLALFLVFQILFTLPVSAREAPVASSRPVAIATEAINPFDICRSGQVQGGGYNEQKRRFAWTCGNFNWHGWRDTTQVDASYEVTCTSDGVPDHSCFRAGEKRYVNYGLHRISLAAQYTDDYGKVYIPRGVYTNQGAGVKKDGTRAEIPQPFNPEWEARWDFQYLGYPTMLHGLQFPRGVTPVGEGTPRAIEVDPKDSTVTAEKPRYEGTWILDDMGPYDGHANEIEDGPNQNISPQTQYRVTIGGNHYPGFCHVTSNTDPACVAEQDDSTLHTPNDAVLYGGLVAMGTYNFTAEGGFVCTPSTVTGTNQEDATGYCRGNRQIKCWDTSGVERGRNSGGCIFDKDADSDFSASDKGNVNFGVCDSAFAAIEYDRTTLKQDLSLAIYTSNCADDAANAAACHGTNNNTGFNIKIADLRRAVGSTLDVIGACAANHKIIETGVPSVQFSTTADVPTHFVSAGSTYFTFALVDRERMNLKGGGVDSIGFAPSSWIGRDSANNAADCTSGASLIDSVDDVAACDTDTQIGFAWGHSGVIRNSMFYRGSHNGNKSGVFETFPGGGANDFRNNVVRKNLRGVTSDWGEGTIADNVFEEIGEIAGYSQFNCYTGNCRIENNYFDAIYAGDFYQTLNAVNDMVVRGNVYNAVRANRLYSIMQPRNITIEDEVYQNVQGGPILWIQPGYYSTQKPSVTFRNNNGLVFPQGVANSTPSSVIVFESDDTATTNSDEYRNVLIEGNKFVVNNNAQTNTCLMWFEDDDVGDTAALTRESATHVVAINNSLNNTGARIDCYGNYDGAGVISGANTSRDRFEERWKPTLIGNLINNRPALSFAGSMNAAQVPDAAELPDGTIVTIDDDTTATGTCAHVGGVLTGGSTFQSTCKSDPAAGGTWAPF